MEKWWLNYCVRIVSFFFFMKLLALHKTNKMEWSLIHGYQNMMILWKFKSTLVVLIFFETIKLSVKSPKLKVFTLSWTKTQSTILKKLGWVENEGKKYRVKTQKCTHFSASMIFSLCFSVSVPCALAVRFSSLMCLDKVATSSMSEKCFKLRMWSVEFLSE